MKKGLLSFLLFAFSFSLFSQGPTANFDIVPSSLVYCVGDTVKLTDLSTAGSQPIVTWTWVFGDGNSDVNPDTFHVYTQDSGNGTFPLSLTVYDGQFSSTKVVNVTVNPVPTASFSVTVNDCEPAFDVQFDNESINASGFTYEWDFDNGDPVYTGEIGPTIEYDIEGTYSVTLTVTNDVTGCYTVYTDDVVITSFAAGISGPDVACVGDVVTFLDNSTAGADTWTWNVDGGAYQNGTTASSQNPEVIFSVAGDYLINLNSTNSLSGCLASDALVHPITIHPLPDALFTAAITAGCSGTELFFDITNFDADNTYTFDPGDGSPTLEVTAANFSDLFELDGSFTATLTVENEFGCITSYDLPSVINIDSPVANFSAVVRKGCAPLAVDFTNTSTAIDPTNDPIVLVEYDWDCDGVYDESFAPTDVATHDFPSGRHDVCMRVTTDNGCQAEERKNRYIRAGEVADIDFVVNPIDTCIKKPFEFNAYWTTFYEGTNRSDATDSNGDPLYDEEDIEFEWTWGEFSNNGKSATEDSVTFPMPIDTGYMDITLIVTFRGCPDTLTYEDMIYIDPPKSQFILSDINICNPDPSLFPITIEADAKGNHPDVDGSNIDQEDSFPDLSILGSANSTYTQFTDDITVTWKWDDPNDPANTVINTTDLNSSQAMFDANSSTSHDYSDYGEYTIKQIIDNQTTGCIDSTFQTVYITRVDPGLSLSNDSVCLNQFLTFDALDGDNLSTTKGPDNENLTYAWWTTATDEFTGVIDGTTLLPKTSPEEEPTFKFISAGDDKIVYLEVTNAVGCMSDTSFLIDVLLLPSVSVTKSLPVADAVCLDPNDPSTGDAVFSYPETEGPSTLDIDSNLDIWNFGDGTISDPGAIGEHTYTVPNNEVAYTVALSITDVFGCQGTVYSTVEVTWPEPSFYTDSFVPDTICNNRAVDIINTSGLATFRNEGNEVYAWSGDATVIYADTEHTTVQYNETNPDNTPAGDPDYMESNNLVLEVTDQNGCTDQFDKDIIVSLPRALYIQSYVESGNGDGSSACAPYLFTFDPSSSGSISNQNDWTYNWYSTDTDLNEPYTTSVLSSPSLLFFPGNYETEFLFTDGYGCQDSFILPQEVPGASAAVGYIQSVDNCGQKITFTVEEDNKEFPINSGTLYFGDGNSFDFTSANFEPCESDPTNNCFTYIHTYTGSNVTYYPQVAVKGADDCPVFVDFESVVIPDNGIDAGLDASTYEALIGENIVFTDQSTSSGSPIEEWTWEFLEESSIVNSSGVDVTYAFSSDSTHAVVLTVMAGGCYDNDTIYINIDGDILVPNVFTPDGQGGNNEWYVPGAPFKDFELLIFNRWGKIMFDDISEGQPKWNGLKNGDGKLCNDGTYFYIIKGHLLNDVYIEKNGHITLIGGVK